ncbi:hypothetical protein C900_04835 [Fulvivirga imtechensis AK7]|uniref:Lipoprotein n=1 Tax=Fulvivirga imtechensis AK7 TaxID=1237149 RepID=L8JLB8_9BACT|nr:DUF4846 domain-containing protein [Fulvivirga imtechensis]ELR69610.1 hypothetical protein C900_04835 [Fulvivirga imtechensis AK7]
MKISGCILLVVVASLYACDQGLSQSSRVDNGPNSEDQITEKQNIIDPDGATILTRILVPRNFKRTTASPASFGGYLRELPLKAHNVPVKYYNGRVKENRNVYDAVVDLDIGKRDLHQCADAVMRLRAEYLYGQKKYDRIHFNFTNGFRVDYEKWRKGQRIVVDGNKTYWKASARPSDTYETFWKYLEIIFSYAGTLSLEKELQPVNLNDLEIGDVFIQGGSPGHAVIVVDVAVNENTGEKIFLLAQSYMPAQEIQILKNPNNEALSPWYSENFGEVLKTPEWTFNKSTLRRFGDR